MNVVEQIRARLAVPSDFGAAMPYLRFCVVADDRLSGEDVTLQFADEGLGEVHLAHTEWRDVDGRTDTQVACSAIIDWESGAARYTVGDAEGLREALNASPLWDRVS